MSVQHSSPAGRCCPGEFWDLHPPGDKIQRFNQMAHGPTRGSPCGLLDIELARGLGCKHGIKKS